MNDRWRRLVALIVVLLFLLPLYWIGVTALRPIGAPPPNTVEWLPPDPHWSNFADAVAVNGEFGRYLRNSTLVVAAAVPLTLLTASLAGFALAQLPHRDRRWIVTISIALLIVPSASVWVFRFQLLQTFRLLDTLWALILPAVGASSPLYVLLYYWTFRRLPSGIIEAARLDGATALQVWWQVAQPLTRPTTAAVAVLSFALYWGDFVGPVLYVFRRELYTLPVWVQLLKQLDATNWPLLMAGALIITLPVLVIFLLLQRSFLSRASIAELVSRE